MEINICEVKENIQYFVCDETTKKVFVYTFDKNEEVMFKWNWLVFTTIEEAIDCSNRLMYPLMLRND